MILLVMYHMLWYDMMMIMENPKTNPTTQGSFHDFLMDSPHL